MLAGPQFAASGTIQLRAVPGGFRTVAEPDLRVAGAEVVRPGQRVSLDGSTPRLLAAALGVRAAAPTNYTDGTGASPDERLSVDAELAVSLADWYAVGQEALRALEPAAEPVLWPEHFDNAIDVDEINFGVSPGDGYSDEPYAYVGPWSPQRGPFWNAPFGAARPWTSCRGSEDLLAFFREGRALVSA